MKREIKFSLVYQDMWQSSGKYQPHVDQLVRIAPLIIGMGCFARVETNRGAFGQVNLLYGENPNKAVRTFTRPFNDTGVRAHMFNRGLDGLWMHPAPADVRRLMYKVKYAQGVDIVRIFRGLNGVRNIIPPIHYALEGGMIPQATLCITLSPVHTVEYYTAITDKLIETGAPETHLKDMAGVGRPVMLGRLMRAIEECHLEVLIQYHGYNDPGLSITSTLEACGNGADIISVVMEPMSWGKVHPDVISIRATLKDVGFRVPEINMRAYIKAHAVTQEFIDDFPSYFMDPTNKHMSSLLLKCGLPGGMMGPMMVDSKGVHAGIGMILKSNNQPGFSIGDLFVMLFDEVEYVWSKLGCPPLVAPFNRYVKDVASMNIMARVKSEERWSMIDNNIWGMTLGKSGRSPGPLGPEIVALTREKGYEFIDEDPQKNYLDQLDEYRKEVQENGWEFGPDGEELLKLAMHDRQCRDYKSGVAKKRFEEDLQRAKDAALAKQGSSEEDMKRMKRARAEPITAIKKGRTTWKVGIEPPSVPPEVGHKCGPDDVFCYVATPRNTYDRVLANFNRCITGVCAKQGVSVSKDDALAHVERCEEPA